MLRGTIDVQSEVGQGTDVTIRIPLSRLPGTDTPASTPSSGPSIEGGSQDDSMRVLQADYQASIVALYAFHSNESTSEMTQSGQVLRNCIEDWLGLRTSSSLSGLTPKDLIVVEEMHLEGLLSQNATDLPTVVICSNSTRSQAASRQNLPFIAEFISKPFGPHKFAKAVRLCLDKAKNYHLGRTPVMTFSNAGLGSFESETDTPAPELEHLTLETEDYLRPLSVQTNGIVTASDSDNAQMAIDHWDFDSSNGTSGALTVTESQDFPFPEQTQQSPSKANLFSPQSSQKEKLRPTDDLTRRDSRRPPLISRMTEPAVKSLFPQPRSNISSAITKLGETATLEVDIPSSKSVKANILDTRALAASNSIDETLPNETPSNAPPQEVNQAQQQIVVEKRPPRLLLVDDNKINLRLLETYMRKRKYSLVDSAENGLLAVQAAESHALGYDIIFMDISMPIMNGFEATRAIRDIEHKRSVSNTSTTTISPSPSPSSSIPSPSPTSSAASSSPLCSPALIIALTGLASSRDQTEAFTSGVDLFMTKPVSFKEVGRLLDNWEAHGGVRKVSSSSDGSGDGSGDAADENGNGKEKGKEMGGASGGGGGGVG